MEETTPACAALAQLLADAASRQRIAQHLPALVTAFGRIAVQEAVPMAARQQAARALAALQGAAPEVGPLLASLPGDQQQALQQLASG